MLEVKLIAVPEVKDSYSPEDFTNMLISIQQLVDNLNTIVEYINEKISND